MDQTDNLRISETKAVASPALIVDEIPISKFTSELVTRTRQEIHNILTGDDDRLLVIVGPCSVHDVDAAKEYANKLNVLREDCREDLLIVMRVYFEKPRTSIGWKGLINDPDLNSTYHINKGLRIARQLLIDINDSGMPAGTEYLDVITPQYISDVISWGAIGARTTESQVHRQLASGLSCATGFKNGTHGDMQIAVDAIKASSKPHSFLSVTSYGSSAIFRTTGNEDCHIILRGGSSSVNYDSASVETASQLLEKNNLHQSIMIDFAHANCQRDHLKQISVAQNVAEQISQGDIRITGIMSESNLVEGKQDIGDDDLVYGQSITDACLGWDDTKKMLLQLANAVKERRHSVKG